MTDDGDILELPTSIIPEGFADISEVQVAALASIKDADILNVEPLTCEDWELLETRAEFLEHGALLQQISVVYSGQVIPLWVGGKDVAFIRVLPDNFGENDSAWPDPTMDSTTSGQGSVSSEWFCCLRLVRDTRVCVSPKPRQKLESPLSLPLRVYPTMDDYSKPMNELAEALGKRQAFTTPGTALMNAVTRSKIPGLNPDDKTALILVWNAAAGLDPDNLSAGKSCLMQVIFCDDIPENHIGMFDAH